MAPLRVTFTPAAEQPASRPSLPRSGACCATLPSWHPHDVIMLGGYTEDRSDGEGAGGAPQAAAAQREGAPSIVPRAGAEGTEPAASAGGAAAAPAPPRRAPTMEAWTFDSSDGGRWHAVEYAQGSPVPQPRLTCQAAVVGSELWLVGGWDPSAAPGPTQFLNDVWSLDLRSYAWRRVEVMGEEMPRISRFAMCPLPGGRLLLHTHRCTEDVLLLEAGAAAAAPGHEAESTTSHPPDSAQDQPPRQATLRRVVVHGVFPGGQSPPSRGLHSLTAAAAPPPLPPITAAAKAPEVSDAVPPGTALYVYGGAPQSGPMYGDLWALDLEHMTWRELSPEGPIPQARCSHVAAGCGGARAVAAAGPSAGEAAGGAPRPTSPTSPPGRYLLVMGGSYYVQPGRLQPLDDVAVYDTQSNRWVEVEVEGPRPSARNAAVLAPLKARGTSVRSGADSPRGAGTAATTVEDKFMLHGGWRPFIETYNDTYIVTVTTERTA